MTISDIRITEDWASPLWRLDNIYWVKDDHGKEMPFKLRPQQLDLLQNLHNRNAIDKSRQVGFCLDPMTKVLTADLRWVPIIKLKPGDKVVGVDEYPPGGKGPGRSMREAIVEGVFTLQAEAYRITFDDGREVVCTDKHPWLSTKACDGYRWRNISGEVGAKKGRLRVGTKVRWITKPWGPADYEDGWFAGILDGEGSIALRGSSAGLLASQKPGVVWDRMLKYAAERGYNFRIENDDKKPARPSKFGTNPVPKLCFGRMDEMFRLIGQTRPSRFIGNQFWLNRELPGKKSGIGLATIVSIEPVGKQTMVDLQTSTKTYIAEGFVSHNTTAIDLMGLDGCIWNKNFNAAIIANTLDNAGKIFSNKVEYPWKKLPQTLRDKIGIVKKTTEEIHFGNGSTISVGVSSRSATLQFLHVSEFGYICRKFPEKAKEIITGSFPAVTLDGGLIFVESTADGAMGPFYDMVMAAHRRQQREQKLTALDFKLHFYPWFDKPGNRLPAAEVELVPLTSKWADYFAILQTKTGRALDDRQKAWYIKESENLGSDMKREHPGTVEESFETTVEGAILEEQMDWLNRMGHIGSFPWVPTLPVHTFWDLRGTTAIWCLQRVQGRNRFIYYTEALNQGLGYFVNKLNAQGYTWGTHHLPHDGRSRMQGEHMTRPQDILAELGFRRSIIVPRISNINLGIKMLQTFLLTCDFDQSGCADGLRALYSYQREYSDKLGKFMDHPLGNWAGHGTDAIRQAAQGYEPESEFAELWSTSMLVTDTEPLDAEIGY